MIVGGGCESEWVNGCGSDVLFERYSLWSSLGAVMSGKVLSTVNAVKLPC